MTLVVGVDIGGTKTAAGLIDPSGVLLATATRPTPATEGPDAVLRTVTALIHTLLTANADSGRGDPASGREVNADPDRAARADSGRGISASPDRTVSADSGRGVSADSDRTVSADSGRGVSADSRREADTDPARGTGAGLDQAAGAHPGRGVVCAVGVGSAGVIDPGRGVVVSATGALAGWAGTDLRGELVRRLGLPVAVDNDVHAHALGEQWRGAAVGKKDVLLVAAGTGIGASVMIDGRIRHGAHAVAGHAGHMPVAAAAGRPCPCGGSGHVEAVASGPALLAEYRRRTGADVAGLAEVARLAADGDTVAAAVLAEGGAALGSLIGGLMNVLDPEIVVIGGGVTGCGDPWWQPLRAAVAAEILPALRDVPVVPAALGGTAALLGAARLALTTLDPPPAPPP